ncbi:CobW HypB UreG nucleotide binding domain [Trypanosoma vivax]|nr:CobW HypB UreG nucleotide binding domain [Trypanosoma vivax]
MSDDECPELVSARVPVTILNGFLGRGKTTLLYYVLSAEHSLRIAVIVNEFEFTKSIEKGLTLKSSQKPDDEWLELNNRCTCCTAQTQTVKALEGLMQSKGTFDLVLVETSCVADPAPVAAMFWQDESLCGSLYLSGIITVVDAKNLCKYLSDPDVSAEATRQVLMADRVVLNKCDIATDEEQGAALDAVKRINPVVQVVRSSFSRLEDLRDILMLNTTRQAMELSHLHALGPSSITAVSLEFFEPSSLLAVHSLKYVDMICRDMLYSEHDPPFEVLRCKAALWIKSEDQYALVQLQTIGELFDVTLVEGQTLPLGCSRALILGRQLDKDVLRSIFLRYIVGTAETSAITSATSDATEVSCRAVQ